MLLDIAGRDATAEFEDLEHSGFARETMKKFFVGDIVEAERKELNTKSESGKASSSGVDAATLAKAAAAALFALYAKKAYASPSFPAVTYSKALRHFHLSMAVGIIGMVGLVRAARQTEDMKARKALMNAHKTRRHASAACCDRSSRLKISVCHPPPFKGPLQAIEPISHKIFYALMLFLPATGIASEYFSGAGLDVFGLTSTLGGVDSGAEDASAAKKASSLHASAGKNHPVRHDSCPSPQRTLPLRAREGRRETNQSLSDVSCRKHCFFICCTLVFMYDITHHNIIIILNAYDVNTLPVVFSYNAVHSFIKGISFYEEDSEEVRHRDLQLKKRHKISLL